MTNLNEVAEASQKLLNKINNLEAKLSSQSQPAENLTESIELILSCRFNFDNRKLSIFELNVFTDDFFNEGVLNCYNDIFLQESLYKFNKVALKYVLISHMLVKLEFMNPNDDEFEEYVNEKHLYNELLKIVSLDNFFNNGYNDKDYLCINEKIFMKIIFVNQTKIFTSLAERYRSFENQTDEDFLISAWFLDDEEKLINFKKLINKIKNQEEYNKESLSYYYKLILANINKGVQKLNKVKSTNQTTYLWKQLYFYYIFLTILYFRSFLLDYCNDCYVFDYSSFILKEMFDLLYSTKMENILTECYKTNVKILTKIHELNLKSECFKIPTTMIAYF